MAICIAPATLIAGLLARRQFPGKVIVELVVMLPLVIPPVVTGYLLLLLLGRQGLVGGFCYRVLGVSMAFNWVGIAITQAVVVLPLLVLTLRAAIESIDRELEEMAITMGATPFRIFWSISLPLSWHGLAAGCTLAFARAIGEFGATVMIAGNISDQTRTLPLAIYAAYHTPGPPGDAAVLGLVLIAIAVACAALVLSRWLATQALGRCTMPR